MTRTAHAVVVATTAAVLSLAACSAIPASGPASVPGSASVPPTPAATVPTPTDKGSVSVAGAYIDYSQYQASGATTPTVVLFFHATWCPTCRAADKALHEQGVPHGLTVVKVDYDSMTELRQRYGITQQHTFVLVDASGQELRKWSGSADGAQILEQATTS